MTTRNTEPPAPGRLVDHATLAVRELGPVADELRRLGFPSLYGGAHSNGVTQMTVVPFADGSYLELISTIESDGRPDSYWWSRHIAEGAGPCAWCLESSDLADAVRRAEAAHIPARGPVMMSRRRPDGLVAEWSLAFLGEGEPGATLPFLIDDLTPRETRVPAADAAPGSIRGIAEVVVAVADLEREVDRFAALFGCTRSASFDATDLDASVVRLDGSPVALAYPTGSSALRKRLDAFGPSPVAFILSTADFDVAASTFDLSRSDWFGREIGWIESPLLGPGWIGIS
jgi:hypothetical protein